MVAFVHLCSLALLARQLERWLEEVDKEPNAAKYSGWAGAMAALVS
jgi:hypothetical protein